MQNYIIDPRIFYWINVLGIMQTAAAIVGAVCLSAFIGFAIGWIYNEGEVKNGYKRNVYYMKTCKRWTIMTGTIGLILLTASIFIPGRTTSIEMLVAKIATFDNVNWTVQQVKEVVDYIVKALQSV